MDKRCVKYNDFALPILAWAYHWERHWPWEVRNIDGTIAVLMRSWQMSQVGPQRLCGIGLSLLSSRSQSRRRRRSLSFPFLSFFLPFPPPLAFFFFFWVCYSPNSLFRDNRKLETLLVWTNTSCTKKRKLRAQHTAAAPVCISDVYIYSAFNWRVYITEVAPVLVRKKSWNRKERES